MSTQAKATACYVYGIVSSEAIAAVEEVPAVRDRDIEQVECGEVAAIVEGVDADRPLGRRSDLIGHSEVLNGIAAARIAVIPVEFGAVLERTDAVQNDLLGANAPRWREMLDRLVGTTQFSLHATYQQDVILSEIVAEDRRIAQLRERAAESDIDAQLRLGEAVAGAMESHRLADVAKVEAALTPYSMACRVRPGTGTDGMLDGAFLVGHDDSEQFVSIAEGIAAEYAGRARLRLLGPLAPFDFVDEGLPWAS